MRGENRKEKREEVEDKQTESAETIEIEVELGDERTALQEVEEE